MPAAQQHNDQQLLITLGQLLEATKAASDSIKSLSIETAGNARAITTITVTLETITNTVNSLNRVVRDNNGDDLTAMIRRCKSDSEAFQLAITSLKELLRSLDSDLSDIKDELANYKATGFQLSGAKTVVITAAAVISWLLSMFLGIYSVFKGK